MMAAARSRAERAADAGEGEPGGVRQTRHAAASATTVRADRQCVKVAGMGLSLTRLVATLEELAPLGLAESWDNVGLLIDPRERGDELMVERVLLAIDATPEVVREAVAAGIQCLVAYHPPLFEPLTKVQRTRHGLIFEAARHNFAVYSPHTALDATAGGLNDWLAEAFTGDVRALRASDSLAADQELKLVVFVPAENLDELRQALAQAAAGRIGRYSQCSFSSQGEGTFFGEEGSAPRVGAAGQVERVREVRLEMVCSRRALPAIADVISRRHPYEEPAWEVYPLTPKQSPGVGAGRLVSLHVPLSLSSVVERVKQHLGLQQVRVARAAAHASGEPVSRVALSAGAGGALFQADSAADVYVTGEMRHHDVLAKLALGKSVVLCEHTHSERGYMPRLRDRIARATAGELEILISATDREPLQHV